MNVKRLSDTEAERRVGPVFETQVHRKAGFSEEFEEGNAVSVSEIYFAPGERTTMHKHTVRQILYVTGGRGIVATRDEREEVTTGDMISFPPGEEHWHGAHPKSTFSHISIVIREDEHGGTIAVEDPDGRRSE